MIELMRQMLDILPISELRGTDMVLLKGKYKLPMSIKDVSKQLKFRD